MTIDHEQTKAVFLAALEVEPAAREAFLLDACRGNDLVLETPVALKLIDSPGPAARARILNEVRLARQITHPAVCRVYDVGEDSGIVFFSMEMVNGEDLATLLRRVGRL